VSLEQREFFLHAYRLKHLQRAGWLRVGVQNPESVASHSWGIAFLVLQLCPAHLNRERMLELALVHDIPEVVVGDITPHDNINKQEKKRRETIAATKILPPQLLKIWQEYEDNLTPEAQFVHMLDKLDMALQAILYQPQANTQEFLDSAKKQIPDDIWNNILGSHERQKPIKPARRPDLF